MTGDGSRGLLPDGGGTEDGGADAFEGLVWNTLTGGLGDLGTKPGFDILASVALKGFIGDQQVLDVAGDPDAAGIRFLISLRVRSLPEASTSGQSI